jgi:molybdopterin/thiamine biosynthesis adenylyltransferase
MQSYDFSTVRHDLLFDSALFGDREISVIGVGGIGSYVADQLAGLGVRRISVRDPDLVEEVNPGNQRYGQVHVGMSKCEAMAELCRQKSGVDIEWHQGEAKGSEPMGTVVFMCVNGLPLRRQIMRNIVRYNPHVQMVIEARMGTTWGQVYAIDPRDPSQVQRWMAKTKGDGVDVGVTACGSKISVGTVTSSLANISVAIFMHWWKQQTPAVAEEPDIVSQFRDAPHPNVVTMSIFPMSLTQQFWRAPLDEMDAEEMDL